MPEKGTGKNQRCLSFPASCFRASAACSSVSNSSDGAQPYQAKRTMTVLKRAKLRHHLGPCPRLPIPQGSPLLSNNANLTGKLHQLGIWTATSCVFPHTYDPQLLAIGNFLRLETVHARFAHVVHPSHLREDCTCSAHAPPTHRLAFVEEAMRSRKPSHINRTFGFPFLSASGRFVQPSAQNAKTSSAKTSTGLIVSRHGAISQADTCAAKSTLLINNRECCRRLRLCLTVWCFSTAHMHSVLASACLCVS